MTIDASLGTPIEYSRVLEATPARLYLCDRSGTLLFVSRAAADALGYEPDELIGRRVAELGGIHILLTEMDLTRAQVCVTGARRAGEVRIPRGESFEVYHYDLRPLDVEGDEVQTVLCTVTDITDLRLAQEAERRVRRQLQEALTRVLSGFVRLCSECYAVSANSEWIPLEKYLHQHDPARLSHGYCDACYKRALLELGKL
jgi:PAS domain S-box-containing protein